MSLMSREVRLAQEIEMIQTSLQQAAVQSKARLPEHLFKAYFLPRFFGREENDSAWIEQWVAIAGSPFKPVDIFEGNAVLFEVPPLFDYDSVQPASGNYKTSIADAIKMSQLLMQRSPIEANRVLDGFLQSRKFVRSTPEKQAVFEQTWQAIFARYGLVEPPSPAQSDSSTPSSPDQTDYDFVSL